MKKIFLLIAALSFFIYEGLSQENIGYQLPDQSIMQWADAPMPPSTSIDDEGKNALLMHRSRFKSIEDLSKDELRLAGLRIDPATNIGSRTTYLNHIELLDVVKGKKRQIKGLPENPKISNISWSPKQEHIAFTHTTQNGVALYVVDVKKAKASRLTDDNLNANVGRPFQWFPNSEALLVRTKSNNGIKLKDQLKALPTGPTISSNDGSKAQNRTYQDLLKNATDEYNFEQLTTSEIHKVDINGNQTSWKKAGMYRGVSISPDGNYVMVTEMSKPFSYLVTYSRFPYQSTVYDSRTGQKVKTVLNSSLDEERPKGFMSTKTGKRSMSWRADQPSTLYWVEALDNGDANKEVEFRDVIYQLASPFTAAPEKLVKTKDRYAGIDWGNATNAIVYDRWWNTRNASATWFNPSDSDQVRELYNFNYQDRYNDPGRPVTERNNYGRSVLALNGDYILMQGQGYSADGILPFLDKVNVQSLESQRLWRAKKGNNLERIVDVDTDNHRLLTRIESATDYPNYYYRSLSSGKLTQVTNFENPFNDLDKIHKELITYTREDGLELSATLYLPPGYDKSKKEKLPMVMWAYPREYKDKSSAGQISQSANEFTYPSYGSPIFWVNKGYAVLDDTAFPIVGEGSDQPNDSFIEQLVANGKAAIDAVDDMGYIDRSRVGVGGHSYGAFMTANLLTHSDLFAAGIARSGAYNRTLTPFGFQAEERSYWEDPSIYNTMSPFMNAHKMKHPLLLIHGEADNNSGTYPMQSERYFNALKGLGATTRLVMLPKESHGYRARESVLHVLWEQDQWLEKYVKNRKVEN